MKKNLLVATIATMGMLTTLASQALAAEDNGLHASSDFGFVGELDLEFGGDAIATVSFTNGSSQDVDAGQGGNFALGMHYRPAAWDVDFVATIGYKFVTTAASNADIGIDRTVLQVIALYDPKDSWWIGGGPVWHNGVKFDGDGFGPDIDLGSSTGFTIQAGWKWIGLMYTNMEYTAQVARRPTVDASAIGVLLRWRG